MPTSFESKGYGVILVIVLMLAVAIGSVLVTPEPAITADITTATATTTPYALTRATPQPIAINPQAGRWLGKGFTAESENHPPLQLFFDVTVEGTLQGTLSLYPTNPEIPPNAVDLIAKNGCNVTFEGFGGTINGAFTSFTQATVEVEATTCQVKFYGEVTLIEAVRGVFMAEYSESATLALAKAAELTPIERGKGVFYNYCSACHGSYAEGAPGIPGWDTDRVHTMTDEQLLTIINNGVLNTVMPAWGNVLTEEEKQGVLLLIRDLSVLKSHT